MEYMFMPLKRYFDFSGRSRRKEYWMYLLLMMILIVVAITLDSQLGLGGKTESYSDFSDGNASVGFNSSGGIITMLLWLATLVPSIALSVRRAHDNDKSGWWILVPIYGFILTAFLPGTAGPNRFGPDPKGDAAEAEVFT
jgi:uncharacterized membrane protein YhaH (DUF805 family)